MSVKPEPPPSAQALIQSVADAHEVTYGQTMTLSQATHVVRARHAAWTALRAEEDERGRKVYTLERIASWWGACHTSVQQAVAKAESAAV